jgi:hypothetical protein
MIVYFTRRDYNPFSWAVRTVTGKPYSHVAVGIDGFVYEAVLGGVRKVSVYDFTNHNVIVDAARVEVDNFVVFSRAMEKIGKTYDVPALFWFLIMLTAQRFKIKVKPLRINPKWFICSEYVWYILKNEIRTVTPEQIYLEVKGEN